MVGQTHTHTHRQSGRCQGHAFNARAAVKDNGHRKGPQSRTHTPSIRFCPILSKQQAAGGWQQKSNEFIIYCPHICLQLSVKQEDARSRHLQDLLWTPNPLLFSYGFQFVSSHSRVNNKNNINDSDRCILFQNRGQGGHKDIQVGLSPKMSTIYLELNISNARFDASNRVLKNNSQPKDPNCRQLNGENIGIYLRMQKDFNNLGQDSECNTIRCKKYMKNDNFLYTYIHIWFIILLIFYQRHPKLKFREMIDLDLVRNPLC